MPGVEREPRQLLDSRGEWRELGHVDVDEAPARVALQVRVGVRLGHVPGDLVPGGIALPRVPIRCTNIGLRPLTRDDLPPGGRRGA